MIKLFSLFLLLLILLNPFTLAWIAGQYVVDDGLEPADAVVPLRSGLDEQRIRTEEARRLVGKRYAPVLLLSVNAKSIFGRSEGGLVEEYLKQEGFPASQLRLCENTADSTAEEAQSLRACLEHIGAKEVIVVTSEYHTRRARFILRRILSGSGIVLRVHPVYDGEYWDPHWWRKRRWAKTFFDETVRLIWAAIEQQFPSHQPPPRRAPVPDAP